MVIYAIVIFIAILVGMAISVYAFGTGGKRKKIFQDIYFSIEDNDGVGVLYTKTGEYSAILRLTNPVQKFSANIDSYYEFTHLMTALAQTLGEGYAIHKQDIFIRKRFKDESGEAHEFLSKSYFDYFKGREYTDNETYLIITQESKKSRLFSYDSKKWRDFLVKIHKVHDQLRDSGIPASFLGKEEARVYVDRYFSMNFQDKTVSMTNFNVDEECISMGNRRCKVYSLVDVDCTNLPTLIRPFTNIEVNNTSMPVDLVSAVDTIPHAETVVYNQMIFMPNQKRELSMLDKKKNRHASIPNPSNQIAVEDIKRVQDVIARESKQLVYSHFNIVVAMPADEDIQKCTNHIENAFSRIGIHISKRAYNQLELFVNSFPGNCYGMSQDYDRFLTLSDAAACLMYKEHIQHSEETPLKIYYTDRQGVPVAIDISGKEGKEKITDNSNFFCLGPSGSGKSFHMNSVVRQMWEQNTDVVMVDTGNSYEGLCEYVGGKYISYTEEHPITMNPFRIKREELNVEKTGFLKNLVMLIWKGTQGNPTKTEERLIEQVISEYYDVYFNGFKGFTPPQRDDLRKSLLIDDRNRHANTEETVEAKKARIEGMIDEIERKRKELKVKELSFNSFYEFSVQRIPDICQENSITSIDVSTYRYMMKDFYRGGNHDKTLNEDLDSTLFDETFIVFEIDSIKDDPLLFPLVTLIIMDVFIQKMRIKKGRKALIIEEAWKAISSPTMAEYIKYLYKTVRKFNGIAGVVTQELNDVIDSPIVKEAIINNSDVKILLDQAKFKDRYDDIAAILGLTEVQRQQIFTINSLDNHNNRNYFKEVWICRGQYSDVYGVEEPPECYMAYTTERVEKEALKIYLKHYDNDFEKAISQFCSDMQSLKIFKYIEFARLVNKQQKIMQLWDK